MIERTLQQAADAFNAHDYQRAEALCEQVLGLAPRDFDALHLLGVVRLSAGRAAEAIPLLRDALQADPSNLGVLDALSAALTAVGDHPQAEQIVRRALALDANLPLWHMRLGMALGSQGKWGEAAQSFADAIRGDPRCAEAHHDLGRALMKLHRAEEAVASFERALGLDPGNADTHNALGTALHEVGRTDEAIAHYRRALERDEGLAFAHHNLGNALLERGELEPAARSFERAIALKPEYADAHCNLGIVLQHLGHWEEAVAQYNRALALEPASLNAQYNLALLRLFRHEFEQAWPFYERRLEREDMRGRFRKDAATLELFEQLVRWRGPGEAGVGEVAIWVEQGIGDQVLFSTLIPELVATGIPVLYEVDRRLLAAYERSFPGQRFVAWEEPPQEALQRADRVLLAGSLPGLFRRSRGDFARQPAKILGALPERVAHYRGRLEALGSGLKVALSWHSTRQDYLAPRKSVPLREFAPLLELPGLQFVDVQYGDTASERGAVEAATGARLLRFDEVDYYNDLEEVLAILEACDLLITTSNATAHFAGALGKRTWLLYPADQAPFHYWAHGGNYRSLWYPSVEIVTAPQLTEWPSLIKHAAERLKTDPLTRQHEEQKVV